jgi:hypothetical protein
MPTFHNLIRARKSTVVVEPPAQAFGTIYMPHPTSVSVDVNGYVIPRAVGMPVIEGTNTWEKQGGFLHTRGVGTYVLGPAMQPFPTLGSYQLNAPSPFDGWMTAELAVFGEGGGILPDWRTMTYFRHLMHVKVAGLAIDSQFLLESNGMWGGSGGAEKYFYHNLHYYNQAWHFSCQVYSSAPELDNVLISEFSGVNPFDGVSRQYAIDVTKHASGGNVILEITNNQVFDKKTWAYTGPEVWPVPGVSAVWDNQTPPANPSAAMSWNLSVTPRSGSVPTTTVYLPGMEIDTNVLWR